MTDTRNLRQKLEAVLAPNSGATEGERANARALMEKKGWTNTTLTRDEILQAADDFSDATDDLKAAFDYFASEMRRQHRAWEDFDENLRKRVTVWVCTWCQRTFPAEQYLTGHSKFCEKNPENVTYTPPTEPELARCLYCGQMVVPDRLARHQTRCPERPSNARYRDGQKVGRM